MFHFALLDQVLHRSRHIFDGHVRINAVLIEQIDHIGPEPLERALGNLLDALGPAVQSLPSRASIRIEVEAELGGNHHLSRNGESASPTSSSFVNGP